MSKAFDKALEYTNLEIAAAYTSKTEEDPVTNLTYVLDEDDMNSDSAVKYQLSNLQKHT
jgi:hypothetical protein